MLSQLVLAGHPWASADEEEEAEEDGNAIETMTATTRASRKWRWRARMTFPFEEGGELTTGGTRVRRALPNDGGGGWPTSPRVPCARWTVLTPALLSI